MVPFFICRCSRVSRSQTLRDGVKPGVVVCGCIGGSHYGRPVRHAALVKSPKGRTARRHRASSTASRLILQPHVWPKFSFPILPNDAIPPMLWEQSAVGKTPRLFSGRCSPQLTPTPFQRSPVPAWLPVFESGKTFQMQALARSFTFHLLVPYAVHLAAALLLIRCLPMMGPWIIWIAFIGYFALMAAALIGIPFGILHIFQAVWLAPDWPGLRKVFFIGLLNPSLAAITVAALLNFAPWIILP